MSLDVQTTPKMSQLLVMAKKGDKLVILSTLGTPEFFEQHGLDKILPSLKMS